MDSDYDERNTDYDDEETIEFYPTDFASFSELLVTNAEKYDEYKNTITETMFDYCMFKFGFRSCSFEMRSYFGSQFVTYASMYGVSIKTAVTDLNNIINEINTRLDEKKKEFENIEDEINAANRKHKYHIASKIREIQVNQIRNQRLIANLRKSFLDLPYVYCKKIQDEIWRNHIW